jgi:hypothetical protein
MSDANRLIEKLGLAIHGERKTVILEVILALTQTLLLKWDVDVELYIEALRGEVDAEDLARRFNLN